MLGGAEDDDVVGGSSASTSTNAAGAIGQPDGADNVYGGGGSDLAIGDNGLLTRVTTARDWRTNRANATQTAVVPGRGITLVRPQRRRRRRPRSPRTPRRTPSPVRPAWT